MTQENKDLLFKDLCARLPYGVKYDCMYGSYKGTQELTPIDLYDIIDNDWLDGVNPYLRPMSSMTEAEEAFVYNGHIEFWVREDYCNKHHFDYRGLIEKGLALEAPEGMY